MKSRFLSALLLLAAGLAWSTAGAAPAAQAGGAGEASGNPLLNPASPAMNQTAPDTFSVKFATTRGDFTVEVDRALSPKGADRFYNLVRNGYYDGVRFFRVVPGFMAQFGIHGDPAVNKAWINASIPDEPAKTTNARGTLTFAKRGSPNSRTVQLFINFKDNGFLDQQGFAPFGHVTEGMAVVDSLYSGYGEGAPQGQGPNQMRLQSEGNSYLEKEFPKLDYIKKAVIVED